MIKSNYISYIFLNIILIIALIISIVSYNKNKKLLNLMKEATKQAEIRLEDTKIFFKTVYKCDMSCNVKKVNGVYKCVNCNQND